MHFNGSCSVYEYFSLLTTYSCGHKLVVQYDKYVNIKRIWWLWLLYCNKVLRAYSTTVIVVISHTYSPVLRKFMSVTVHTSCGLWYDNSSTSVWHIHWRHHCFIVYAVTSSPPIEVLRHWLRLILDRADWHTIYAKTSNFSVKLYKSPQGDDVAESAVYSDWLVRVFVHLSVRLWVISTETITEEQR